MSRLDDLWQAAQKATPGPWRYTEDNDGALVGAGDRAIAFTHPLIDGQGEDEDITDKANGTFLALADPQTVIALIEAYRAADDVSQGVVFNDDARSIVGRLRAAIEKVEALSEQTGESPVESGEQTENLTNASTRGAPVNSEQRPTEKVCERCGGSGKINVGRRIPLSDPCPSCSGRPTEKSHRPDLNGAKDTSTGPTEKGVSGRG